MQRVQRDSESKRLLWGIHFHFFCTFISFIRPFNAIIGSLFFVLYWLFLLFLLRRQQMLSGVLLSSFRDPPKWRKLGEPSRIRTHRMTFIIKILPLDYRHIHHSKFRKLHCQPPFHWSLTGLQSIRRKSKPDAGSNVFSPFRLTSLIVYSFRKQWINRMNRFIYASPSYLLEI